MQNRFTSLMHIAIYMYCVQCCALAEPGGRWHPTFALGTRKSYFFRTYHLLGTLDFTGSEHWAPFNFPQSTALVLYTFMSRAVTEGLGLEIFPSYCEHEPWLLSQETKGKKQTNKTTTTTKQTKELPSFSTSCRLIALYPAT